MTVGIRLQYVNLGETHNIQSVATSQKRVFVCFFSKLAPVMAEIRRALPNTEMKGPGDSREAR